MEQSQPRVYGSGTGILHVILGKASHPRVWVQGGITAPQRPRLWVLSSVGHGTEQTGPGNRCGAAAGGGGSPRQESTAMAEPEQSLPRDTEKETKNKGGGGGKTQPKPTKKQPPPNSHRRPAKAPQNPHKLPRASSAKQNPRGDFGKRSSCLPG